MTSLPHAKGGCEQAGCEQGEAEACDGERGGEASGCNAARSGEKSRGYCRTLHHQKVAFQRFRKIELERRNSKAFFSGENPAPLIMLFPLLIPLLMNSMIERL